MDETEEVVWLELEKLAAYQNKVLAEMKAIYGKRKGTKKEAEEKEE